MAYIRYAGAILMAVIILILTNTIEAVAQEEKAPVADSADGTWYVIETRHRLHPNFQQVDTVSLEEAFFIGEEEIEARVILFNPHLGITMEGEALKMSDTLYNPAARVQVVEDGEVSQESWAFYYTEAPHYRREDMLGFRILDFRVDKTYIPIPEKK